VSQNGDKMKGDSQNGDRLKRRQTGTATNHNGDIHFKQTKTAKNRNGDRLKRRQTITATSISNEPKRRQAKTANKPLWRHPF